MMNHEETTIEVDKLVGQKEIQIFALKKQIADLQNEVMRLTAMAQANQIVSQVESE